MRSVNHARLRGAAAGRHGRGIDARRGWEACCKPPPSASREQLYPVMHSGPGVLDQPSRGAHPSKHVAVVAQEIVEVACEARRGRFSARGRSPGSKLEIGVKGACVGDLPASPAATAAAAVQLCPQEESSVEEALFSLCVGGFSPRGTALGRLHVRRGLTPPGPTALQVLASLFSQLSQYVSRLVERVHKFYLYTFALHVHIGVVGFCVQAVAAVKTLTRRS